MKVTITLSMDEAKTALKEQYNAHEVIIEDRTAGIDSTSVLRGIQAAVRELQSNPTNKIPAIKALRDTIGHDMNGYGKLGLCDAKCIVEAMLTL